MKKIVITILVIVLLAIFAFIGWFVRSILNDDPPQFFPLNKAESRYTIIKSSKLMQGWGETHAADVVELQQQRYYVEYRGDGVFMNEQNRNFFRVTVGDSKVDLEPFIGKDVLITKGEFVSSTKQCIVGKCIDIRAPFVVLNIDEINLNE